MGEGIDVFGDYINIRNNEIQQPYFVGIKLIHGASHNWLEENRIFRAGTHGILVSGSSAWGPSEYNEIRNNHIHSVAKHPNFGSLHSRTSAIAMTDGDVNYTKIRNNEIKDGDNMDYAIWADSGKANEVSDNCANEWRRNFHKLNGNSSNQSNNRCPWWRLP